MKISGTALQNQAFRQCAPLHARVVFIVRANPEPKVTVGYRNSQSAMATAETGAPKPSAFLKSKRTVMRIFFPEFVSFACSGAGLGRQDAIAAPEITRR